MTNRKRKSVPLLLDEAKSIISKFLEQTIKDCLSPSLRFSPSALERSYHQTAINFISGEIAIWWDDKYKSAENLFEIAGMDLSYIQDLIEVELIQRMKEYLEKKMTNNNKLIKKKRREIRAYLLSKNNKWIEEMSLLCINKGIIPLIPKRKESEIDPEYIDEIELISYREIQRDYINANMGTLFNADLIFLHWQDNFTDNEIAEVSYEAGYGYSRYIPIYLISSINNKLTEIPLQILAYITKRCFTGEEVLEMVERRLGRGKLIGLRNINSPSNHQ